MLSALLKLFSSVARGDQGEGNGVVLCDDGYSSPVLPNPLDVRRIGVGAH